MVNKRLNALYRITNHMGLDKGKMLLMAFIESKFSYCPLIWMFLSRALSNKINRLNKRALRIVYSDFNIRFDKFLGKNGSFSINHRNIKTSTVKIFKSLNEICPPVMNEVFQVNP